MMNWDSDPALKALRDDFIASLAPRQKTLAEQRVTKPLTLDSIRMIAHKIGGAAGSYGFPTLSEIGGAMDDVLSEMMRNPLTPEAVQQVISFTLLLEEALRLSIQGKDPEDLKKDSRFSALIRAAALLPSESTNESS